jgi:hypothetical protein
MSVMGKKQIHPVTAGCAEIISAYKRPVYRVRYNACTMRWEATGAGRKQVCEWRIIAAVKNS